MRARIFGENVASAMNITTSHNLVVCGEGYTCEPRPKKRSA